MNPEHDYEASSQPAMSEFAVPGLKESVEIIVDRDGVPHIYADNSDDAYFAQGFNIARDRLWQVDFWRRRGLGQLAEVLGDDFIETDRSARLFLFRGSMYDEWTSYGLNAKRICSSFVAGINAYIDLTRNDPTLLPPEFGALGYQPGHWTPADVVRIRNQGVYLNAGEELVRALTLRDFGPDVERLRRKPEPDTEVRVPDGLDLDDFSPELLAAYTSAVLPLTIGPRNEEAQEGSNNWVISGSRTDTGRPILANDPHRDTTMLPGMRYVAHISCPEFDIIGAGEPHLPGLNVGHNGTAAFGYTVFMTDQEDLYVYELSPTDPYLYKYQGQWRPFEIVEETIDSASGSQRTVRMLFSHHGPVLHHDPEKGKAFSLRAAWLEPGAAPYFNSIEYMQAKTWDDFLAAMTRWRTPGENLVYADVAGNIGWRPGAIIPKRDNWDGLVPVPGDGRYEWSGFYDIDELPCELNPARGWIATANEFKMTEADDLYDKAGFFWASPERSKRIGEAIEAEERSTVRGQFALQLDTLNLPAREILDAIQALPFERSEEIPGLQELLAWDHRMSAKSREALIYEVWYQRHLHPRLVRLRLAALPGVVDVEAAAEYLLSLPGPHIDTRVDIDFLRDPAEQLGVSATELATHIKATLQDTFDELTMRLGSESETKTWRWGDLHHALATHPLKNRLTGILSEEQLQAGPLPRGGSPNTPGMSVYDESFRQIVGSTVRFVFDVGDWDKSLGMNAPGQSGDPRTEFHTHLFERWVKGDPFPLRYSRTAIESAVASKIYLRPL